MTEATFHHASLLAGSRDLADACVRFYRENFGMSVAYSGVSETNDFVLLSDNVNPALTPFEIIGRTAEDREDAFLESHGPGLDHLCFAVTDLRGAYRNLAAAGVPFHVPPYEFQGSWIAWCKDPAGTEIELLQIDVDIPAPAVETMAPRAQYNHVAIATASREEAQATEDFYCQHMGMTELLRGGPSEDMDWVYLQDASGGNPLWLEIIRAIFEEERAFVAEHGSGLEHHCFVVDDAVAFHAWLRGRGVALESNVFDFVGAKMFFVRDPAGTRIQVLQMPEGLL